MDGSISLTVEERKVLFQAYRSGSDVGIARRAHVVLLRVEGCDQLQIPVPGVMKVGLGNLRCVAGVEEKAEA